MKLRRIARILDKKMNATIANINHHITDQTSLFEIFLSDVFKIDQINHHNINMIIIALPQDSEVLIDCLAS